MPIRRPEDVRRFAKPLPCSKLNLLSKKRGALDSRYLRLTDCYQLQGGGKWKTQRARSNGEVSISASGIHNNDRGIFVTCDMGQEGNCLREMNDLLSQVCLAFYSDC